MNRRFKKTDDAGNVADGETESFASRLKAAFRREEVWQPALLGLLLVVATLAAYQPVWHAGFIWNDDKLLTAPDGLKRIWFSLESRYVPLVYTTFRIEHALWGLNPVGYHWVNLALHVANALLLWRLLSWLRIPGAWLAAALFALHPVQVESVAWITERKNLLMGFFFLLALMGWEKFTDESSRGRWKFYLAALLCFVLALASEATACVLPVVLLLPLWGKREAINAKRWIQIAPFVLLGLGAGLVTIWWERYYQGTGGALFSLGILERVLVAARAFWFYFGKLFWPAQLAFSYPRWSVSASQWTGYLWIAACFVFGWATWWTRRFLGRGPEIAVLFFAATLAPTLGFIMLHTFRDSFVADHYQYLAIIGPLTLGAAGVSVGASYLGRFRQFLFPVVCAALLIPLGMRTWRQSGIYENAETLWRATIAANPTSWLAQNNLALPLLYDGRAEDAIGHFEEALRLDPNYAEAHYNLANALFRSGRIEEARTHYERALQLFPEYAAARYDFAVLLLRQGEAPAAIEQLEAAIKLAPRQFESRQLLGNTLLRLGRPEEAIVQLQAAAEIEPASGETRNRLAAALFQLGRMDEASAQANRLVAADPQSAVLQTQAGLILSALGKDAEAGEYFERAVQLDPRNAEAQYNTGNTFLARHEIEKAMAHYRQAVESKPDHVAARLNLANALMESDRLEEAVAEYERVLAIEPDYALAHKNLASALNGLGRFDEGMEHLQAAWKIEAQPAIAPERALR